MCVVYSLVDDAVIVVSNAALSRALSASDVSSYYCGVRSKTSKKHVVTVLKDSGELPGVSVENPPLLK